LQDEEIRKYADRTFNEEFYLDTNAQVNRVANVGNGVEIEYINRDGVLTTETFEYLLAATGRRPNVDNLGLENTSIQPVVHLEIR
jgi:dihydrolipoamide dehydrogenase